MLNELEYVKHRLRGRECYCRYVTLRLEEHTRVMSHTLWHTTPQCVVRVEKPCAQSKETSYCEIVFEHSFTVYRVLQPLSGDTNVSSKFAFLFTR